MNGAVNPAAIAASISIGVSLLGGFFSILVAVRSRKDAAVTRDTAVLILFGIAFVVILLNATAASLMFAWGMAYVGLLKATLLLTAAFASLGIVFGLVRGVRSGKAITTRSA
jgi:hypothetical protein